MAMEKIEHGPGGQTDGAAAWNPFTGQRVFRSARAAWVTYGQHRFSFTERTFYNHVGKGKGCPPREDGRFYIEDIELFAQSHGWPVTSLFVRGAQEGGRGESPIEDFEVGRKYQEEKYLKARIERRSAEIDLQKKVKEVLLRSDYEKRLAAAAAVVSNGLETLVYDHVREMIHLCGGKPEKEDSLREYLLEKIRVTLHAFSYKTLYAVSLVDDNPSGVDWEEEAEAYAIIERSMACENVENKEEAEDGTGDTY